MSTDLTTILSNLAQSLLSIELLVGGISYVLGIALVITGFIKFTKVSHYSHETASTPISYILGGGVLIYLPSSIYVVSNTFFGSSNILSYTQYSSFDIYGSVGVIVQAAGLIWFVRGTVLLVHASEPGKQKGNKGLFFLIAGVLAMNFTFTVSSINAIFQYFISMTSTIF